MTRGKAIRRHDDAHARDVFEEACAEAELDADERRLLWELFADRSHATGDPSARARRLVVALRQWNLYRRSRAGDEAAAAEFRDHWKRYVGAFLAGKSTPEEADELTSRFFERVYAKVGDTYDWRAPFTAYLRTILVNLWRDRLAERARREDRTESLTRTEDEAPVAEPVARTADPDRAVDASRRLARVRAALDELSPLDRHVIVACLVDGTPGQDVAETLGVSRDALYQRLHRARKRLATQLQDLEEAS